MTPPRDNPNIPDHVKARAKEKAEKLKNTNIKEFAKGGLLFTLSNQRVDDNGVLWMDITVTKDGKEIPLDNPFGFVNPPIEIPDANSRMLKMIERPQQAFKLLIYRAVSNKMKEEK